MPKMKPLNNPYILLRILFTVGFFIFLFLSLNEAFLQPYRSNQVIRETRELYHTETASQPAITIPLATPTSPITVIPETELDDQGRLIEFKDLLLVNEDVKGWLTIPDTNIDYVVLQSDFDHPEFYLDRNLHKQEDKAGSLFLDYKSSVEMGTKNLVIHGHNMSSTKNMFHSLLEYKTLDFYKERPVIQFDSIYQKTRWKVFAVIVTNGSSKEEKLFNYTQPEFEDSFDFLNFIYQIKIRSIYKIDTVDLNENDEILTLSTCSYELNDYRTVVFARKVRDGENLTVDVDLVTRNPNPLYPDSWYNYYGGNAPEIAINFEAALRNGEINWYQPLTDQ